MEHINPKGGNVKEMMVISGLKVVEVEYKVQSPVFEDIVVKVPKFVDEEIKVPVGFDALANKLSAIISDQIMDKLLSKIDEVLEKAIDERISTIKAPHIVEEIITKTKEVEVEKPIFKDVEVIRPVFKEEEIIKPIMKFQEITNAVIKDKEVVNAIVVDQKVTNAIITDVDVERAVIRERVIDVIHPRYLNLQGEPDGN